MAPSYPPRKFAPTPIEQTTKSSRQQETEEDTNTTPKPRRFAPEPVEHSVKSSKDAKPASPEKEEKRKARRFAPEPVEHSVKSSKDGKNGDPEPEPEPKPKPRRFAPQMVEETMKSSKDVKTEKSHVKFMPEPIATTFGSNRKSKQDDTNESKSGSRKFAPILLDTAKRSRRATDREPALSPSDKTESGYSLHAREYRRHITGEITPAPGSAVGSEDGDSQSEYSLSPTSDRPGLRRRSQSPLDGSPGVRAACLMPHRQHSYHMPDLDTIESSESEPEPSPRSLSPKPNGVEGSPITASASGDSLEFYKHATRIRESVDENFTQYLLEVERKKAQKRLEEQALAAYPNPDFGYEAPRHYGINDDDDQSSEDMEIEERPVTWEGHEDDLVEMSRRESTTKGNWEQMEMQRHAEEAQQERNANKTTAAKKPSERPSPWWNPATTLQKEEEADKELRSMRDRARPPMLGSDIVFPRCPSPEPARFDVTQGPATLRNQMCYLTEAVEYERSRSGEDGGLWRGVNANVRTPAQTGEKRKSSATPTRPSSSSKKSPDSAAKGLWGGFCVDDGSASPSKKATVGALGVPSQPTGLKTPKPETAGAGNPFEKSFAAPLAPKTGPAGGVSTPPTPPASVKESDLGRIDSVLQLEKEIDRVMETEFTDAFITQVYNYLSLGYPSLARPFDEELSKISRFSMAELRSDDVKARNSPRGYIRLGSDFEGGGGEGMVEEECVRWRALKRYVREWAKQERGASAWAAEGAGNWGTGARRGSWAI